MSSPTDSFEWNRWPATEAAVGRWVGLALEGNSFAARLAARMTEETNTRLADWVDHLVVGDREGLAAELRSLGYARKATFYAVDAQAYAHNNGVFPRVVVQKSVADVESVAVRVESVADFSRAHDLGLDVQGYALGPYRSGAVPGARTTFKAVERRGYTGFEPFPGDLAREGRLRPHAARDTMAALELWRGRRRNWEDDEDGIGATEETLGRVVETAGSADLACDLVFRAEREYWQSRNRAARVQKARQDALGLGWANHDHHTFRSSRRFFPQLIAMFETLGFTLRERFHAGEHAGWGAQILEHPTTGIVIFADLDLAPLESTHDFAHDPLPDLARPNTVGLWVGLHGESILGAGMHHLEAQFAFDGLRAALRDEAGVETMKPFSDFPFLRQAFTAGEKWRVEPRRADRLLELGWIDVDQHAKFLRDGAIGSHLENLQRGEGYKGFNQQAVSAILKDVDPRLH